MTSSGARALVSLLLLASSATSAEPFAFENRLSDFEGRWVVLPGAPGKDVFPFGFVYVDPEAGFTLDVGGLLRLDADGKYVRVPDRIGTEVRYVWRMDARRNPRAAPLPKEAIAQLGLEEFPAIIRGYADTSDPITHRVLWGRHLNHVGDSRRALEYLEPAYAEKPDAKGLEFELAYAYNALERPRDALAVLEKAVARSPGDLLLGVELAYAHLSSGRLDLAIDLYLKLIPRCGEREMVQKSEMAYNLSGAYTRLGDEASAEKWLASARAWAPKGSAPYERFNP